MKEIPITNIENIRIGNAQDSEGATGCTVLLCEKGAPPVWMSGAAALPPGKASF